MKGSKQWKFCALRKRATEDKMKREKKCAISIHISSSDVPLQLFLFLHTDFNVFYLFFFVSIFSSTLFSLPCHLRASPFTRKVTECKKQKIVWLYKYTASEQKKNRREKKSYANQSFTFAIFSRQRCEWMILLFLRLQFSFQFEREEKSWNEK